MAQSGNDRTAIPDAASLREVLARFQDPLPHVAARQIATTILPLIALLVAMYARAGLRFVATPRARRSSAAALTVRTFIDFNTIAAMDPSAARAASMTFSGGSARYANANALCPVGGATTRNITAPGNDLDVGATLTDATYTHPASRSPSTMRFSAPGVQLLHRTAKHPVISLLVRCRR